MKFLDFLAAGETPLCLADGAKILPTKPNGKHLSIRAIERYICFGYGPAEAKVFLEGARVANSWATSREALQRFMRACTEAEQQRCELPSVAKQPAVKPSRPRGLRASRARRDLAAAGWGSKSSAKSRT